MRPIATDTHDFPSLRRDGCIYVDKTKYIHRLVANKAFTQLIEKNYASPYLASGLPIYLIGLSFDPQTRHLVEYGVKELGVGEL